MDLYKDLLIDAKNMINYVDSFKNIFKLEVEKTDLKIDGPGDNLYFIIYSEKICNRYIKFSLYQTISASDKNHATINICLVGQDNLSTVINRSTISCARNIKDSNFVILTVAREENYVDILHNPLLFFSNKIILELNNSQWFSINPKKDEILVKIDEEFEKFGHIKNILSLIYEHKNPLYMTYDLSFREILKYIK